MPTLSLGLPNVPLTLPENSTASLLPIGLLNLNALGLPVASVSVIGPDAGQFRAVYDSALAQVTLAPIAPLDYEVPANREFQLGIRVTALGGLASLDSAPFNVTLADVNDVAPGNVRLSGSGQVFENLAGATVGTLLADDPDTVGAGTTFSIVSGADASLFEVASDGVTLKLAEGTSLDFEARPTYVVQVRGFDGANFSAATSITVTAIDRPDGPGGTPAPVISGTPGNDVLNGTAGADTLQGLGGNDTLNGSPGADVMDGGAGNDTANYAASPAAVTVDLVAGTGRGGDAEGDTLVGIENVIGSAFDDVLRGDGAVNILTGGAGNDTLEGRGGGDFLDGGTGTDTGIFSSALSAYEVSNQGTRILISGPDGPDTLVNIERLVFADGTVNLDDGDPLFDPLFYYRANLDVFAAGIDAKTHYANFGYREGRDPNAYFDSSGYLSANPDVAAAGLNPLEHYRTNGFAEGRDPSTIFDTAGYLASNPDVRAAGVEALTHFLNAGLAEGRLAQEAVGSRLIQGFDVQFYLMINPDVGRAGIDPYNHWLTFGANEGRDPNANFDTSDYLAIYQDVAASGINPLTHYMTYGYREGRDPSANFDTTGYLEQNPDVAAAGLNPLDHYMSYGIYEGRVPVNDGVFG